MEYKAETQVWLVNPEDYVWGAEPRFWVDCYVTDMTNQGWVKIATKKIVIKFDLPSQDAIRGASVETLREAIRKIDAEAQKAKNHLEGRIQNLLAIGHEARPAEDGFDDSDWPV